jgi:glycogen debranching enzyme
MTTIETDDTFANQVIERSLRDIRMLAREDGGRRFIAAGTPWFDTLFGRDSCVLGMQTMSFAPAIARNTLLALAGLQGTRLDPSRDEEPGKILHEQRISELSSAGELPYGRYYGSIDSTPLFMMLLAEHAAWTRDDAFLADMLPAARAAFDWMRAYGGLDRDGLLAYQKRALRGLVNQGWKDSADAVPHEDGGLAQGSIALVEVQAYAYRACATLADAVERIGETGFAADLRATALALRSRVNSDFWCGATGTYALALDGARAPVRSVASNPGHALWCGIADVDHAASVAATRQTMSSREVTAGATFLAVWGGSLVCFSSGQRTPARSSARQPPCPRRRCSTSRTRRSRARGMS